MEVFDELFARPLFSDRFDGGRQLADALRDRHEEEAVVVGLARGGIQVAAPVAAVLAAPLDVVAVRKVRHPFQPEYAIGAVTPGDGVYVRAHDGLTDEEVEEAVRRAQGEAAELEQRLHGESPPVDLEGKVAIVVDDGLATGATMIAAVRWARSRGARRVVAAVPVAAAESCTLLRSEADEVVCPHELPFFVAVGIWYEHFPQVTDTEVTELLAEHERPAVREEA
jgi:predicted phosphoribosyltransferase